MRRPGACLGVMIAALVTPALAPAVDGPAPLPTRLALEIAASQVAISIEEDRGSSRAFRATVLSIREGTLTVLTAARFVDEFDPGRPARLLLPSGSIEGTVLEVIRNPAYRPEGSRDLGRLRSPTTFREVPGSDNAIARVRFAGRPGSGDDPLDCDFRALRPAPALSSSPCPGPSGGTLTARSVDAEGREHAVRAGNYTNPRLLAWGHAYDPRPVDTGGGVFAFREGGDGRPRLALIGVLLGPDDHGGAASLVALSMPWLAGALRDPDPAPGEAEASRLNRPPSAR